jgi:RNA polymerase sigma-70 factor (family 1)
MKDVQIKTEIFIPEQKNIICLTGETKQVLPTQNEPAITMIDPKEVVALQHQIASAGDQTAYVRLYRIYFTPLLQFARSFVKSTPLAEEVVSDIFLQLWQNRAGLTAIENLTVYLYTSARNRSLNYLQKEKRLATIRLDDYTTSLSSSSDPEQLYITSELAALINNVIEQLPPKCKMIFKLIREDQLKYREVAQIMDISQKTVEAQMGIALRKLHEAIKPYTGQPAKVTSLKPFKLN